jgi:hypothetical protein
LVELVGPLVGSSVETHAVLAHVDELVDTDHTTRVVLGSAADTCNECVSRREVAQDRAGRLRNGGIVRSFDDRRQRAVDIEKHACRFRLLAEACNQLGHVHADGE